MGPMDAGAPDDPSPEASEAVSDEVQSASRSSSSPGGEQVSGGEPGSGEAPARLEPQDAPSDRSGERFLRKRINCLQGKGTNSRGYPPDPQPPTEVTPETTPVPDEQMHALQAFCTSKINLLMHRQAPPKGRKGGRQQKLQLRWDAEASEGEALHGPAPDELLDRVRLKNVVATLQQAAAVRPHAPARCPACNRRRAELAQAAFLQRKKTLLESLLLREKIEERLHTTDFLTFIREAHRGLPRLSDDPRVIWKRLNERSREKREPGLERLSPEQRM